MSDNVHVENLGRACFEKLGKFRCLGRAYGTHIVANQVLEDLQNTADDQSQLNQPCNPPHLTRGNELLHVQSPYHSPSGGPAICKCISPKSKRPRSAHMPMNTKVYKVIELLKANCIKIHMQFARRPYYQKEKTAYQIFNQWQGVHVAGVFS